MDLLNPYYLQVVIFILINSILGLSIYITLSTGQLTLGNAGFMSIGAYVAAILTINLDMSLIVAMFFGGVAAALMALFIGLPTTRLQGLYLAIATLGFGEVVRVVFLNLEITNGALGLSGIKSMAYEIYDVLKDLGVTNIINLNAQELGNLSVIILLSILLILIIVMFYRIENSRIGRAFAAIKSDEQAASLIGINVVYYKILAFVLGAFIAGVVGGIYAHVTYFINPTDFSYHRVVSSLLFVVFGGSNVILGPVLGSFILTLLPEVLRITSEYREMIYGAILILLMIFRTDGILTVDPIKYIKKKLSKKKRGDDNAIGS